MYLQSPKDQHGVALLIASALAGLLWDTLGASWTFIASGGLAAAALLAMLFGPPVAAARV